MLYCKPRPHAKTYIGAGIPSRSVGKTGDTYVDSESDGTDDGLYREYVKQRGRWYFYVLTTNASGLDILTGESVNLYPRQ